MIKIEKRANVVITRNRTDEVKPLKIQAFEGFYVSIFIFLMIKILKMYK